jgi:hypothetical protein
VVAAALAGAAEAAKAAACDRPRLRLAAAMSMTIIRLKRIRFLLLNAERISLYRPIEYLWPE